MSEATFNPPALPSAGEIAPYSPTVQPLVPVADSWDIPAPDLLAEHNTPTAGVSSFFGQPMAPGAEQELKKFVTDATEVFANDMAKLGFSESLISVAINWYQTAAFGGTPNEVAQHNYSLSGTRIPTQDQPFVTSFLNRMAQVGAPENFIRAALWWVGELGKRIQAGLQSSAQTSAPNLSRMSDKQREVEADRQLKLGLIELQSRWGAETSQRLNLIQKFLSQFPQSEVVAMEQRILPNGHLAGSDPDYICYLYQQAVGGSLPSNSAGVAAEIKKLENYMKTNYRTYIRDESAQARLRLLYEQRGH